MALGKHSPVSVKDADDSIFATCDDFIGCWIPVTARDQSAMCAELRLILFERGGANCHHPTVSEHEILSSAVPVDGSNCAAAAREGITHHSITGPDLDEAVLSGSSNGKAIWIDGNRCDTTSVCLNCLFNTPVGGAKMKMSVGATNNEGIWRTRITS